MQVTNYQGKNITRWSKDLKVPYHKFRKSVIDNGFEKAISMKYDKDMSGGNSKLYFIDKFKKKMTCKQISVETGINYITLAARCLRSGGGDIGMNKAVEMGMPSTGMSLRGGGRTNIPCSGVAGVADGDRVDRSEAKFPILRIALKRGLIKCHKTMEPVFSFVDCLEKKCTSNCFDGIKI